MIYLAVDLETVLDVKLGRKMWPHLIPEGSFLRDARARMRHQRSVETDGKSDFLKPIYHQVVAVGMAYYDTTTDEGKATSHVGLDEHLLLGFALGAIAKRPTLVTFNGRGFDLPVIRYRSLIHNLDASALYGPDGAKVWTTYDYRFGGPHLDLADILSGYGASSMASLNELLLACDMAGKVSDGSQVEDMVEEEKWEELKEYVQDDAWKTLQLGLRFEQTRGRVADPSPNFVFDFSPTTGATK
jgi:3'-5' exonuclease